MNDDTTTSTGPAGPDPVRPAPLQPASNVAQDPAPTTVPATPVEAVQAAPPRSGRGASRAATLVNIALGVALVAAVGGVAFAAGRMTAPATAAAGGLGRNGTGFPADNGDFPAGGQGPQGGLGTRGIFGADGGLTIQGTVESSSADTLTIKTASGETVQIAVNGTTTYHAETSASSSDVKTGGTVIVRVGLRQPDGSGPTTGATASDVTVVP